MPTAAASPSATLPATVTRAVGAAARRRLAGVRAAIARQPWLVLAFALAWLAALAPIWLPRFLPLLDLPNHLDAIAIWNRYDDRSWGYAKYYRLNLIPLPYWGYFFPVHLLSRLIPLEVANKLYLSAYALALPVGAALLARQMGRSPWLALFAFPLVFNMTFSYGFITFCVGLALLLFALLALDRFLERPTGGRALALFLLSLGLYTSHVLPWLYFGVASPLLALCHGFKPRRVLAALALELPSLLLAIYGFRAAADGSTAVATGAVRYEAKSEELIALLREGPGAMLTDVPGSRVSLVVVALFLVWLALLLSARDERGGEAGHDGAAGRDGAVAKGDRGGFAYRLELLALLALLAYLKLPAHLLKPVDLWMVGGRFLCVAALFGALVPRGPIVGWRRWLLVPVLALALVYPLLLARHWVAFDRRAASFRRLMRQVPRGASTLTLIAASGSDPDADARALPYLQFHAYAQYLAGGYDPWALSTGFPFTARPEAGLPAPMWKHPYTFSFDLHGVYYDYIATKSEVADYELFGPDDPGRAPLIAREDDWRLYRVVHP